MQVRACGADMTRLSGAGRRLRLAAVPAVAAVSGAPAVKGQTPLLITNAGQGPGRQDVAPAGPALGRGHRLRLQRRAEAGRPEDEALQDDVRRPRLDREGAGRVRHHDRPGDRAPDRDDGRGEEAQDPDRLRPARGQVAPRQAGRRRRALHRRHRAVRALPRRQEGRQRGRPLRRDREEDRRAAHLHRRRDGLRRRREAHVRESERPTCVDRREHAGGDGRHLRPQQLAVQVAGAVDGGHGAGRRRWSPAWASRPTCSSKGRSRSSTWRSSSSRPASS